mmetsp:Transcript_23341/g.57436  ORF Transcript_23341/g.57436 Transcript_23341/m.57436 type:complete len:568 (-) Transcript_23341:2040-3743(-)
MMSDVRFKRKIGKRRLELPQMNSMHNENVEVESSPRNEEDTVIHIASPQFPTRRQSGAWIFICVLIMSVQGCESFTSTSRSLAGVRSLSSKPQSTILRLVEAEAPTFPTEERSMTFQPSIPDHSIICEKDSMEEREPTDSTTEAADQQESTETRAESDNYSESGADEDEIEKEARLNAASRAAALLANRKSRVKRNTTAKGTSVGTRRMGAASKALNGAGTMSRLTDAIRHGGSASKGKKKEDDENDKLSARLTQAAMIQNTVSRLTEAVRRSSNASKAKKKQDDETEKLSARLTQSAIHSAVGDMLTSEQPNIGVLGEASVPQLDLTKIQTTPPPGTILVDSPKNSRWKASDRVSVRVATQGDDLDIANLRLSVFSNFSPDMRQSFCSRSCHVLAMRRNQGATCIVATVPRYGSIMSNEKGIVLGTAECSIHEFFGTRLGSRRKQNSILYITEVAVSPTARRKGIGAKMMQSIDELAKIRGVETLYLHVEVTNTQALNLYEKAGFKRLTNDDRMYSEFTRSLGLHDGAMKGRCHYLMYKDVQHPTWVSNDMYGVSQRGTLGIEVSA